MTAASHIDCDGCHRPAFILMVVTGSGARTHLCWRCWAPAPANVVVERLAKKRSKKR